ncbi:Bromodomain-containing protein [Endogone sp. FLAS-F59071]|nr:Bromodomain-containing protein [Endogone sp. FLAS-F59071]|eukprot:RUS22448.1 Bromodomain-containing protein [Endogone sp. FLAS-F59071]
MQREQTSPDLTAKSKRARVENDDVEMNLNDQAEGSVPNGAVKSPSDANVDSPISTNQLPSVSDSQNAQTEMASLTIDDFSPQTEQTFNLHEGANFEHLDDASIIADSFPAKAIVTPNNPTQPKANDPISQVTHRRTKKPSRKNDEHEQSKTMRKDSTSTHGIITTGRRSGMSRDQLKFSSAIIKQLKKHRDAGDFVAPVDIEKYKIYDYVKIIKTPMDLGTVEQKLNDYEYDSVDAFVSDVRLIFTNCYTYNGRESAVSNLAHNLEMAFEKSLKQMPQSHEATSPPVPTLLPTPSKATETSPSKTEPASKIDTSQPKKLKTVKVGSIPPPQPPPPPIVRRPSEDGRPKREIHPPPSKDYPETPSTKRNPKKNDMQLKFCVQALKELKKSKYAHIAWPFMTPVDHVKLAIPNYPKIIKHPMDISTIERKLNNADYNNADEFESDIRLMFKNCYTFNEPASDVYVMGKALEKVFDEKWAEKPAPPEPEPGTREVDASDEDDSRDQQIAELERHLAMVSQQIASMKSHKDGKRKKDKDSKRVSKSTKPSKGQTSAKTPKTSSKVPRAARPSEKKKRLAKNKLNTDGDDGDLPQFTFDQKRELSELINTLNGEQLSAVVQIIQTTVPNLNGGGEEEIELDIDSLDLKTLHKLHQFVRKAAPKKKKPPPKKPRVQHSEEEHDRKILELEIQLQKFEKAESEGGQGVEHDVRMNDDGDSSSSDSSSSSGSDSEDSGSDTD